MKSSLEIAQEHELIPIEQIAERAGLLAEEIEPYGRYKAKVALSVLERLADQPDGKLVCVTGMTPTKAGEGKTTTLVGLTQGLGVIGKSPVACLREASVGPVFGTKGGAAGGDARRFDPAWQPAQDRCAASRLAAGGRHQRPGAAADRGWARRPRERLPTRDRVRYHRRIGGDGDHGGGA